MSAIRRVAAAVTTIENRLPPTKHPAFWYKDVPPNGLEFEANMCAFTSHMISMRDFPKVDPGRKYAPGQIVVLLTDRRAEFEGDSTIMQRSGMPLSFLWEQQIAIAGSAYWITATEVLEP